ncbi:MAG: DUF4870 domain-containing protein [Propionibacteriaceae bacterium]|nr:DUF4870 domain-containing protein [Propionibacteriaceae bacterium]
MTASAWHGDSRQGVSPQADPWRGDPWGGRPLAGDERRWVPAAHWLPLVTSWLGPLTVLLTVGERDARVREHAKESLNAEITVWLGMLLAAVLSYVGVGFVLLGVIPVAALVLRVVAAVDAGRGKLVRYPIVLRLVR